MQNKVIEISTLVQINATIIAGVLILMAFGGPGISQVLQIGTWQIPANAVIGAVLFPFCYSEISFLSMNVRFKKLTDDEKFAEIQNFRYNGGLVGMFTGFFVLVIAVYFTVVASLIN